MKTSIGKLLIVIGAMIFLVAGSTEIIINRIADYFNATNLTITTSKTLEITNMYTATTERCMIIAMVAGLVIIIIGLYNLDEKI